MHEQGVAHRSVPGCYQYLFVLTRYRDCTEKNILMDAKALYPEGFHPVFPHRRPNGKGRAPILPRDACPIKYYYVDFGISSFFPPDSSDKLVVGTLGRDQDVPELSKSVPYDPYKVDVFILGNFFRTQFLDVRYSVFSCTAGSH